MEIKYQEEEKNHTIPLTVRWEIVHLKRIDWTSNQITEKLFMPASSCNRIYVKWLDTADVTDLPCSGRPSKLTKEDE